MKKWLLIVFALALIFASAFNVSAATGASLHIIKPMGFTIDDKKLKRAGLDYWDKLDITYYENYSDFVQSIFDAQNKK